MGDGGGDGDRERAALTKIQKFLDEVYDVV